MGKERNTEFEFKKLRSKNIVLMTKRTSSTNVLLTPIRSYTDL